MLVWACGTTKNINKTIVDEKSGKKMLTGDVNREAFKDVDFKTWFDNQYEEYEFDSATVSQIKQLPDLKQISIVMVFGSWCGDSRRDVPRFYRILDELKFPDSKLAVVAVDRTKTANSKALKDLTIERVPTIFFYENNVLLGKIVETPEVSLEKDMLKIIQNSDRKWK